MPLKSDTFPITATPAHAAEIAALHVRSWRETYHGLLPEAEIARHDEAARQALWSSVLQAGKTRVILVPGVGFAAMGPQRDTAMSGDHPEELLALYILRLHQGKGFGRRLLNEVRSELPFTAWVLAGNTGAERFYAAMGGRALRRATEEVAGMNLTEILLSFPSRADAP